MSPTPESFPPVPGVVRLLAPLQLRLAHESGLATAHLTRPSDWCRPGRRDPASALGPRRRRTARELGRATAVLAGRLDAAFEAVLAAPEGAREAAADGYRRALAALAAHLRPMGHGARRASPTQQALQLVRTAPLVVSAPIEADAAGVARSGDLAGEIRRHVNAGEGFEASAAWAAAAGGEGAGTGGEARARAIAFYLPQFHAFAENDAWWGTGFSEWRNVCRGTPRFVGHYQPRVPRDLGFYDLTNEATLHAQAALARANGIAAFCFYHYWFDGKRLMERPLDLFVEAGVEQEFCLMWANENWTRTWDGLESEVLIEQTYREEDEAGFIADTARYMRDERYVRVAGRPLFIVYRPGLLPESRETLARWRRLWTEAVGAEPWLLMVQGFEDEDPRVHGLDGAVEFPPHKVCKDLAPINAELAVLDPAFAGHVLDYEAVVERSLGEAVPEFPLVKTVVPHWDNDARREGRGLTLHGSSPARYERWLRGATGYARANRFGGEALVFVNAWNEWAEGAYLEPDVHWGHAYLNATRRAVLDVPDDATRDVLLVVARDADAAAAPGSTLDVARTWRERFGVDVALVLERRGSEAGLAAHVALAHTLVLEGAAADAALDALAARANVVGALHGADVSASTLARLGSAGLALAALSSVAESPVADDAFAERCWERLVALRPGLVKVSVIVPSYEYARYLPARLTSVFEQRLPVFETIVLDDASRDDSVDVIRRVASAAGRHVRLVVNEVNGGGVFRQWRRGLELAGGTHVWIAEADDLASPDFLAASVAASDADTVLSFTDSHQVGPDDEPLADGYGYYFERVDATLFGAGFALDGAAFARRALAVRNVVLNVSAVLWRRDALAAALVAAGDALDAYRLVGDWRLYLEVCALPGAKVVHVAASLNTHRRHPESVTHSLDARRHLDEIVAMHEHARGTFGADAEGDAARAAYVRELREQFGLDGGRRAA